MFLFSFISRAEDYREGDDMGGGAGDFDSGKSDKNPFSDVPL